MSVSWVTRHQGMGGTTAHSTQKEAVEQYSLYLGGAQRADLFRVSHDGDIESFAVRARVEHAVFLLPAVLPAGMAVSPAEGIIVQHVLSSTL